MCLQSTLILSQIKANVVGIKNGDRVVLLLEDNRQEIRLADVDCPGSSQSFGKNTKLVTNDDLYFELKLEFYDIKNGESGYIKNMLFLKYKEK